MKTLIHQLLERAESAGGEEWLRQCLASPLNSPAAESEAAGVSGEGSAAGEDGPATLRGCLQLNEAGVSGVSDPVRADVMEEGRAQGHLALKRRRSANRKDITSPSREAASEKGRSASGRKAQRRG